MHLSVPLGFSLLLKGDSIKLQEYLQQFFISMRDRFGYLPLLSWIVLPATSHLY